MGGLPRRLRVEEHVFPVKRIKPSTCDQPLYGFIELETLEIFIVDGAGASTDAVTLTHELFHGLLHTEKLRKTLSRRRYEEMVVSATSNWVAHALIKNQNLVKAIANSSRRPRVLYLGAHKLTVKTRSDLMEVTGETVDLDTLEMYVPKGSDDPLSDIMVSIMHSSIMMNGLHDLFRNKTSRLEFCDAVGRRMCEALRKNPRFLAMFVSEELG